MDKTEKLTIIISVILSLILLASVVSIPWRYYQGRLLLEAVDNNDLIAARKAIKRGAFLNIYRWTWPAYFISQLYDETPLLIACREGNFEMVELLVDAGADVNLGYRWPGKYLPVEVAFSRVGFNGDSYKIAKFLIDNGADCSYKNCKERYKKSWNELLNSIVEHAYNDEESYKEAFELFVIVYEQSDNLTIRGGTLLTQAAYYGNIYIVQYLIEHENWYIYDVNPNGKTAYDLAAEQNHAEVAEYLWQKQLEYANAH